MNCGYVGLVISLTDAKHGFRSYNVSGESKMEPRAGLEPAIYCLRGNRRNHLATEAHFTRSPPVSVNKSLS